MNTVFHRDGTVTFWNVFTQTWSRFNVEDVSDRILSSLSEKERKRIIKLASKVV